jgi:hypothetical protein
MSDTYYTCNRDLILSALLTCFLKIRLSAYPKQTHLPRVASIANAAERNGLITFGLRTLDLAEAQAILGRLMIRFPTRASP